MIARPGVARFLARRLAQAVPTVLLIIVVNFLVLHLTPGDIVDVLAGEAGAATPEYVAMLRQRFGLDRPLLTQLASYVWGVVNLDLGFSFRHNTTVFHLVMQRFPATLILMGTSLSLAVALGVICGVTAARHVNRPADGAIAVLVLLSYATPTFWIGLMMIVLFSVKLGWLPTGGMMTIGTGLSGVGRVLDVAHHLVLPAASLALFYAAIYTRLMRASMLEVAGQDYVRTARAKGISEARVMYGHALRNALLPLLTMVGVQVGSLLGGSVLVESVFGWPGLGRLAFEAVQQRDYNLLLGILLMSSLLVIAVNLVIDLLYAVLDPRIELRSMALAGLRRFAQGFFRRWTAPFGLAIFLLVLAMAVSAPYAFREDPFAMVTRPLQWPGENRAYILGSDMLGRDILAGIFHGARVSLAIGGTATAAALGAGVLIGALAGYYGGLMDDLLMRATEAFQTIPPFVLVIVVVVIARPSIRSIILAIALVSWPAVARLVRAEFIALRHREFVQGCRAVGMGDTRIIFRQILPNALAPIIVTASIMVATAILTESALAFLGLGDANVMSWGSMIGAGREMLRTEWYLTAIPGFAILLTVLALNLIGEGLNDALNPRLRDQ